MFKAKGIIAITELLTGLKSKWLKFWRKLEEKHVLIVIVIVIEGKASYLKIISLDPSDKVPFSLCEVEKLKEFVSKHKTLDVSKSLSSVKWS